MPSEALLAVVSVAILINLVVMATLIKPALFRRRSSAQPAESPPDESGAAPPERSQDERPHPEVRLVPRERRIEARPDGSARRTMRPLDEGLDEVLEGHVAAATYNRAIRILAFVFILSCSLIVTVSQLWQPVTPIVIVLMLAGVYVLVVHDLLPAGRLGSIRIFVEGTAAVAFLAVLVRLTDGAASPFFFLFPLLVGAAAMVAGPAVTLLLSAEVAVAYLVAAFSEPLTQTQLREAWTNVGVNVTALCLLGTAGMIIAGEQRRTRDAAIRLSTVDSLTDLYNRGYFFTVVDREIQRSRRYRRGFCLLMMDLDGLKSINDRYGHFHGDTVLRSVAEVIRAGLRGGDVAARYGGDEFVALLPETDPTGAYVAAEKIRQGVSELIVEAIGQHITTSLSIGVVSFPDDGQTADELMIAADEAMYSSKRLGKNRVVGFAEPAAAGPTANGAGSRSSVGTATGGGAAAGSGARGEHTPGFRPLPREGEQPASKSRD